MILRKSLDPRCSLQLTQAALLQERSSPSMAVGLRNRMWTIKGGSSEFC